MFTKSSTAQAGANASNFNNQIHSFIQTAISAAAKGTAANAQRGEVATSAAEMTAAFGSDAIEALAHMNATMSAPAEMVNLAQAVLVATPEQVAAVKTALGIA